MKVSLLAAGIVIGAVRLAAQGPLHFRYEVAQTLVFDASWSPDLLSRARVLIDSDTSSAKGLEAFYGLHQRATAPVVIWLTLSTRDSAGGVAIHLVIDSLLGAPAPSGGGAAPVPGSLPPVLDIFMKHDQVQAAGNVPPPLRNLALNPFAADLLFLSRPRGGASVVDSTIADESLPALGTWYRTRSSQVTHISAARRDTVMRVRHVEGYSSGGADQTADLQATRSRHAAVYGADGFVNSMIGVAVDNVTGLSFSDVPASIQALVTTLVTRIR